MGANPHANGGLLLTDLKMPDFSNYAIDIPFPGEVNASDTLTVGNFLRDVIQCNDHNRNFRILVQMKRYQINWIIFLKPPTGNGRKRS